jgi:hypothetical protein
MTPLWRRRAFGLGAAPGQLLPVATGGFRAPAQYGHGRRGLRIRLGVQVCFGSTTRQLRREQLPIGGDPPSRAARRGEHARAEPSP